MVNHILVSAGSVYIFISRTNFGSSLWLINHFIALCSFLWTNEFGSFQMLVRQAAISDTLENVNYW